MSENTDINIPKGVSLEEYTKAQEIVVGGFQKGDDEETIKTAMFSSGISFSKVLRLFKRIAINENLIIDPKVAKENISNEISGVEFTAEDDYTKIEKIVTHVLTAVEGATEKRILSVIKARMESMDLTMPKKPKAKKEKAAATSKIAVAITNLFAANADATQEEYVEALSVVCTEKSITKWARLYGMLSAIARGQDSSAL